MQVEVKKPEHERGYYLHPEVYGQPEEKSMDQSRLRGAVPRPKEQREQAPREQLQKEQP